MNCFMTNALSARGRAKHRQRTGAGHKPRARLRNENRHPLQAGKAARMPVLRPKQKYRAGVLYGISVTAVSSNGFSWKTRRHSTSSTGSKWSEEQAARILQQSTPEGSSWWLVAGKASYEYGMICRYLVMRGTQR